MDPTILDFLRNAGSIIVALSVLCAMLYGGHRLIWMPSQRQTKEIAKSNAEAAKSNAEAAASHAEAAKANEKAAQFNAATSEANTRTAAHLERLTEMLLDRAIGKQS